MAYNTGTEPTLAELITAKFVPEMFSQDVFMHTMANLVCVNAFNTTFKAKLKKGSKVWIPVMSEGSATEVTPGTEATASDLANASAASITVDNWYYASAESSDLMEIEDIASYLDEAAISCAYTLQKKIDSTVGALFSGLASSSAYGSDGQTFSDEIFTALVEGLDEQDIPDSPRVLIGDASTKRDCLDIEKFIHNSYIKNGSPVVTGQIGELYGAKVLITNNLTAASTGNYGVYAHKDAIGIVLQKEPRSRIWDMGYKFITKIIVDGAWGADEIRDAFGKSFYTRKA